MSTAKPDTADTLSLPEMLRIMDVATTLRQDRELVQEQLDFDALKARLRDRMLAAAKVTGEEVTPEEIDAAIDLYYRRMYTYRDPPLTPPVLLAHLYVRRRAIAWAGLLLVLSAGLWWWLFASTSATMTARGRNHRAVVGLSSEVTRRIDAAKAISRDPAVLDTLGQLATEAETYRKQDNLARLKEVVARIGDMEGRLQEEHTVTVIQGTATRGSALVRYFTDKDGTRRSGYYLVVEARGADGKPRPRRVHSSETDKDREVTVWAERVPKEVYDRLHEDKQVDGILNETTFAVKKRGLAVEQIVMPGADGKPLTRLGQITEW